MENKIREFIKGLDELSAKTGIAIGGCGCCGSPLIREKKENTNLVNPLILIWRELI